MAERKIVDAARRFPFGKAALQVALKARRGLVAFLGCLGEQLHDDRGNGAGTFAFRSAGGTGFLAMWQCTHSIGSAAVNGRAPVSIW